MRPIYTPPQKKGSMLCDRRGAARKFGPEMSPSSPEYLTISDAPYALIDAVIPGGIPGSDITDPVGTDPGLLPTLDQEL